MTKLQQKRAAKALREVMRFLETEDRFFYGLCHCLGDYEYDYDLPAFVRVLRGLRVAEAMKYFFAPDCHGGYYWAISRQGHDERILAAGLLAAMYEAGDVELFHETL